MDKLPDELMEGAEEVVHQIILNHFYMGTLTDSDCFKYTPAYTGDAWDDKDNKLNIKES